MMWWVKAFGLAMMPAVAHSYAATDSPQDVDPPQSGYLPNHNINPSSVSSTLAIAWKQTFNLNEIFYAKPLVYTLNGAPNEYVITVSNQNIVRVLDGLTGNLISSRTLDAPFASSDTDCGDIPNTVGITGTPIIDTATDIMYFFAKGYQNGQAGPQGTILGQYKFHAVQLPSLAEVSGFPVIIDGNFANNDHTRYFVGGTVLNRPGLAMIGDIVIGGFGGHCDNFNYTGMLVAVSKTPGVGVTNIQAMEASPGAPQPQELDILVQGGGKAGIWQSGMGIAADTNRVFFVTGNARGAGQNGGATGAPASGKVYLSTLEQAVVNMGVDPVTGSLTQQDYFEPYGYDSDNGGDLDFGSGGLCLLDPTTFYGTGVSRIAVAGGKDGKVYFMNANNLGGFAGGNAGEDDVLQSIVNDANSIRSGPASYPLEGGYVYISPVNDALYAYKFSNANGVPHFTLAGTSARNNFAGLSVPTVTSNNGAPGTGIVWLADVNYGLQAYNAVPVNGVLVPITLPAVATTGSATKYQRVVFGDGTIYFVRNGQLMMLSGGGVQSSAPVTCTPNPVTFGSVMVASTSTIQVTCTANTAITAPSCNINSAIFNCGSTTLPATVASGKTFTFPVVFNLSDAALLQYENAASKPLPPGTQTVTLTVDVTAGSGYLPDIAITVSGTVIASAGYLTINQTSVSFGGVFIGGAQPSQASRSVTLSNLGSSTLTFKGFAWQDYYQNGMPYHNVTSSIVGNGYTSPNFPAVGSTLAAGASLMIPLVFSPLSTGISATYLTFWSDGGYTQLLMQGTATEGLGTSSSSSSQVSLTSTSSSASSSASSSSTSSSSVVTTSSSSRASSSSLSSSTSSSTLSSSTISSTTASSSASAPTGPVTVTNVAGWSYLGCYSEATTGRALNGLLLPIAEATCTVEKCAAACIGYTYFGVEYHGECYCGNVINAGSVNQTSTIPSVNGCDDTCLGNANEYCGGANRLNMYSSTSSSSLSATSSTISSSTVSSTIASSSTISSTIASSSTISSTTASSSASAPTGPVTVTNVAGWSYLGCYSEATTGRALNGLLLPIAEATCTVEKCAAACIGYTYFGVEYHGECYCGNVINAGSVNQTSTIPSVNGCDDTCLGNANEYCGGANRLNMYQAASTTGSTSSSSLSATSSKLSSSTVSSTASSSIVSSTTASSSTSAPTGPVTVTNVAGWSYLGCYSEATTGRALNGLLLPIAEATCTVEKCAAACIGYTYFGVEYHGECYCGNVINAGSVNQTSTIPSVNGCDDTCLGNANEYCGGANRLNMYQAAPTTGSTSSSSLSATSSTLSSSTLSSRTTSSSVSISTTLSTSTSASISTSSTSTSALPYITPPAPQRRTFTWSIGWVEAAPDGFSRPFIGINGQWPCPSITINMGDTVILTVTNNLVNESTAIHFHGIHQTNTTYADGPAMVTQCPIQPGATFVYEFTVNQYGTYWYHAHIGGQYIDGFRGPFYITDVNAPYRVSQEYGLTLSDLYHQQAPELINYYQSVDNANNNNGAEPVPNSILINEAQNVQFSMVPGETYLFRIINMGAFTPQYLQFDQHNMTVVEIDGVYTQPYTVSQLFITVAQRYSVIVTAKASSSENFAIKASMSTSMFFPGVIPATFNTEVSAYLVYNAANPLPPPITITRLPFDDSVFVPYDQQPEFGPVTLPLQITVDFGTNANGQYRGYMNGIDFIPQQVPTLYTALNAPANLVNDNNIYGINSNAIVLPYGAVVELVLQNHDSNAHPFHLHGHSFQVVARDPGGSLFPINPPPGPPMRRDTVQMMGDGSVTIRFVANNPGINLFHCHIEWHVEAGLVVTFIEAPTQLQAMNLYIPASHKDVCAAQGIAMTGNAAGNTANYTDLAGANVIANTSPWGSLVNPPTTPAPPYDLS